MNKKNYVLILSLGILCLGSVSSYAPNAWDVEVMDRIDSSLQVVADT